MLPRNITRFKRSYDFRWGFPGGSDLKEFICSAGDPGLIPVWERYPGEMSGYPLQYSYLERSMDRGALWGLKESDTTERLTVT